jgi:hypothetical protein
MHKRGKRHAQAPRRPRRLAFDARRQVVLDAGVPRVVLPGEPGY